MDYSAWFREQLSSSAQGFVWAALEVPAQRRDSSPPLGLGEWSAARHVFHLLHYEREIALPSLRQWLGGPPVDVTGPGEDAIWLRSSHEVEELVRGFSEVRSQQLALLPQLGEDAWQEVRPCLWGRAPLLWVMSKTLQHTFEHASEVMRITLFWDAFAARERILARQSG